MGNKIALLEKEILKFHAGNSSHIYQQLGCHYVKELHSYRFCVWAPNADSVSVVGDFNNWDGQKNCMERRDDGIFTALIPGIKNGDNYKYLVTGKDGYSHYKADPFAFYAEIRPRTASRVWSLDGYEWADAEYIKNREQKKETPYPMSVYELHLGSWARKKEGGCYSYRELAERLIPYLNEMGFTHIELLPLTEYPSDASFGYQATGYFAVTSRYGTPQDFMYFVDQLHGAGIGLLLDWTADSFPRDEHGLREFDGTALYESERSLQEEVSEWGTLPFQYSTPEVQSFLLSSAMFFIEQFHVDGLRINSMSSILYHSFGKEEGQFIKNKYGGNENLEAIDFIKKLNTAVVFAGQGSIMIAEESSAYPQVTKPPDMGGLGFTYKWDIGFTNDMTEYMQTDPLYRKYKHNNLTFSIQYACSEQYILAFSHKEVMHGKRSLIDKMAGDYWQKFASLRAFYGYLFAHPGKKLIFMGDEFAQFDEWNCQKELDWFLLEYKSHRSMQYYVKSLNHFYREHKAFYELDDKEEGFTWLGKNDREKSIISFLRCAKQEKGENGEQLVCLTNFTPVVRYNYQIPLPSKGILQELFNSDDPLFHGSGVKNEPEILAAEDDCSDVSFHALITVPPLATVYFRFLPE